VKNSLDGKGEMNEREGVGRKKGGRIIVLKLFSLSLSTHEIGLESPAEVVVVPLT